MALYNPLSWQNENGLTSYPFAFDLDVQDFLVDAKFVQFDGFTPVLNKVKVNADNIIITLTFDYGASLPATLYKEVYELGDEYRSLRLYNDDASRYMGVVTFGSGVNILWDNYVGRELTYNAPFAANTTSSIPSKDAVYTLDSNYGDVQLSRTLEDKAIFYNVSTELNALTFNAVYGHAISTSSPGGDGPPVNGLRQINLVRPINNNINLASNDVIKITSRNAASLYVDLVAGTPSTSFLLPTLIS